MRSKNEEFRSYRQSYVTESVRKSADKIELKKVDDELTSAFETMLCLTFIAVNFAIC